MRVESTTFMWIEIARILLSRTMRVHAVTAQKAVAAYPAPLFGGRRARHRRGRVAPLTTEKAPGARARAGAQRPHSGTLDSARFATASGISGHPIRSGRRLPRRKPCIQRFASIANTPPKFAERRTETSRSPAHKGAHPDLQVIRHLALSHQAACAWVGVVIARGDSAWHFLASHGSLIHGMCSIDPSVSTQYRKYFGFLLRSNTTPRFLILPILISLSALTSTTGVVEKFVQFVI